MANKIEVQLEVRNKASDEVKKFGKDAENTFNKARADAERMNRSMSSSSDKFTAALNEIKAATSSVTSTFSRMGSAVSRQFSSMVSNAKEYKKSIDTTSDAAKKLQTATSRMPAVNIGKGAATTAVTQVVGGAAGATLAGAGAGGVLTGAGVAAGGTAGIAALKSMTDRLEKVREGWRNARIAAGNAGDVFGRLSATVGEVATHEKAAAAQKALAAATEKTNKVSGDQGGILTKLKAGWLAIAGAIYTAYRFLKSSYDAYAEAAKVESSLASVLQATGYAAGFSVDQLKDQATELQNLTGIADETILGVQAIVSTFKNIRGTQFKEVTELALDLSRVLGTDAKSSAMQLSKALESPTEGLDGLRRAGIMFTDQEKETIQILMDHNKILEAQGIILEKVRGQVKGVAKAFGDTEVGRIEIATQAWDDMKESIGRVITTLLVELAPAIKRIAEGIKELIDAC